MVRMILVISFLAVALADTSDIYASPPSTETGMLQTDATTTTTSNTTAAAEKSVEQAFCVADGGRCAQNAQCCCDSHHCALCHYNGAIDGICCTHALTGEICKGLASATPTTTTTTPEMMYYKDLVDSLPSLQGKCVAITGTTSGLGYWAAVATARKNASCLIMLNRNSSRAVHAEELVKKEAASGVKVITVACDLQSIAAVRSAASEVNRIAAEFGGLDVLALNAGVMSQPDVRTADGFDVMMQTNHLSHFLLTKMLMPSLRMAAKEREARVVSHSSLARGHDKLFEGGGSVDAKYYTRSPAGTLGGNGTAGSKERYHQSKLANIVFAMALHDKLSRAPQNANIKALAAAPGFSETNLDIPNIPKWIEEALALSAPDGSCSLLTAMFLATARSGDFYEPKLLSKGPPSQVIAQGVPLPPHFPRGLTGIHDAEVCDEDTQNSVWRDSEVGLGEKFIVNPSVSEPLQFVV